MKKKDCDEFAEQFGALAWRAGAAVEKLREHLLLGPTWGYDVGFEGSTIQTKLAEIEAYLAEVPPPKRLTKKGLKAIG